jgi:hypothetical protein
MPPPTASPRNRHYRAGNGWPGPPHRPPGTLAPGGERPAGRPPVRAGYPPGRLALLATWSRAPLLDQVMSGPALPWQDLALAWAAYQQARARGDGLEVDLLG